MKNVETEILNVLLFYLGGIYCPNTKGHYSAYTALDSVQEELADRLCAGMKVKRHSCVFYINFSDVNGVPTYDPEFS